MVHVTFPRGRKNRLLRMRRRGKTLPGATCTAVKLKIVLNRRFRFILVSLSILMIAQRSPAPIIEENQTPAPEQPAKRKRSKSKTVESESGSSVQARTTPAPMRPSKKFAGTWVGVMPEVPWGNVQTKLAVGESETTMGWEDDLEKNRPVVRTQLNGDTISAQFPGVGRSRCGTSRLCQMEARLSD